MSDYNRSTRECLISQIRPEMLAAIRAYVEKNELEEVESGAKFCVETTNEKKKGGLFGGPPASDPDKVHYAAIVITPPWFIGVTFGEKAGVTVTFMPLRNLEVKEYQFAHMIPDTGIEVTGFRPGDSERGSIFWGLGTEPAADRLRTTLKEVVAAAG